MNKITIEVLVKKDIATVWKLWNTPEDIQKWAFASNEWECPHAENDIREGGKFLTRMAAKDKSASFDITGAYDEVRPNEFISYTMADGRRVDISFENFPEGVHITETFDMENENPEEVQRGGWQSILNNFKSYAESN